MKQPNPIVLDLDGHDTAAQDAEIRARGPVVPVEIQAGVHAWVITGADPLKSVLAGDHVSKDGRQHWPAFRDGQIGADHPLATWTVLPENMFTTYGPEHKKLRQIAAKWFTHRNTQGLRPRIEVYTTDLLDGLAALPAGEVVDLRDAYAYPLPIRVISELLGVPEHLQAPLRACVDGLFNTSITASYAAMYALLAELVEYRTQHPGDDLTSLLVAGKKDTGVTDRQIADTMLLMISAGHETTVNLLDQVIYHLNAAPHWRAAVMSGEVTWRAVFDETLRLEAPVRYIPLRYAVSDFTLCGVDIKAGDPILASYGLAGRDPEIHGETADQFDPTRPTRGKHISFGHGAHRCLGEPLALMEAEIAAPALFARFPEFVLTTTDPTELGSTPGYIANGHNHLPALLKG
ncbi:cytochrome P450 [Nocardia sp. NPDC051750]|uniref:cytochrome P450 n=1 Tax=Nocardia sp. NPDC051750 TaxID=3364325 RepID=UPI0037B9CF3A